MKRKICLFHKWELIKTSETMYVDKHFTFTGGVTKVPAVVRLEQCSKCSKERAYIEAFDGQKADIALWYAKQFID